MTEHEKLKAICDKIGYELNFNKEIKWWWVEKDIYTQKDVREIIFTQEFMDLYWRYIFIRDLDNWYMQWSWELLKHLDNPIDFFYSLLEE